MSLGNVHPLLVEKEHKSSCPMTLTVELDLHKVKLNLRAEYLGHRSFGSKVIVWTHTLEGLLYVDH